MTISKNSKIKIIYNRNNFFVKIGKVYLIFDPLEQFEIANAITSICFYNIPFFVFLQMCANNVTFSVILSSVLFAHLFIFAQTMYINGKESDNNVILTIRSMLAFIKTMVVENILIKVQIYFPYVFSLFLIILSGNFLGMLPYSYTITSAGIVTFYLSLKFFIGVNIIGLIKNQKYFVNLFMPSGSPLVIMPLLVLIELLSYFARVLSLAIRLFANMMSGHTLLKILTGFA